MKKKLVLAILASALLIALVSEVYVGRLAKANPWIMFHGVEPIPGTIPPFITILSPQNNTAYDSDTVLFSFSVTKPQPPSGLDAGLADIDYTLDDNRTGLYYCTSYSSNSPPGLPQFTYSANLTLPKGGHYITVSAGGVVLPGNLTLYGSGSSATISFSTQPDPTTTPFPISDIGAVKVISPVTNGLYFSNGTPVDVPFIVHIDGTANWLQYTLFAQNYKYEETITGNTTLHALPLGTYVLTLYVNNTITYLQMLFNVTNADIATPSPSPTTPTQTPKATSNPTPSPSATPPKTEISIPSPTILPSTPQSSTQQPTPSSTPNPAKEQSSLSTNLPLEIASVILVILAALAGVLLGLWIYLKKKRS